ncbi:hypothetical protein Tco_0139967 [Tanacetum coccineum]
MHRLNRYHHRRGEESSSTRRIFIVGTCNKSHYVQLSALLRGLGLYTKRTSQQQSGNTLEAHLDWDKVLNIDCITSYGFVAENSVRCCHIPYLESYRVPRLVKRVCDCSGVVFVIIVANGNLQDSAIFSACLFRICAFFLPSFCIRLINNSSRLPFVPYAYFEELEKLSLGIEDWMIDALIHLVVHWNSSPGGNDDNRLALESEQLTSVGFVSDE